MKRPITGICPLPPAKYNSSGNAMWERRLLGSQRAVSGLKGALLAVGKVLVQTEIHAFLLSPMHSCPCHDS